MKMPHALRLAAGLILLPPALRAAESPRWLDPADPSLASAVATGKATAETLVRTLTAEMGAALGRGGPAAAVEFCQISAQGLTAGVAAGGEPTVIGVKRTSLKVRNPANAPDAAESAALERVRASIARGEPPPELLLQRVEPPGAPDEIRFYRPLKVAATCLACHGDPAAFPAELRETLARRYPRDAATGYQLDGWRGLLRVSLAAPASASVQAPGPR